MFLFFLILIILQHAYKKTIGTNSLSYFVYQFHESFSNLATVNDLVPTHSPRPALFPLELTGQGDNPAIAMP